MKAGELSQVGCASLPLDGLAALGDLRRAEGVLVTLAGERAWVRWTAGDETVLRRVLPLPGAELYSRRGSHWYRFGARLPSFGLPVEGRDPEASPLHKAVVPQPVGPEPPGEEPAAPVPLVLTRGDRVRAAAALRCPLAALERWADSAPTARFSGLLAAAAGGVVLVVGRTLPEIPAPGAERFWGSRVLRPLGFRAEPDLPEPALRRALGVADDELPLLSDAGVEVVPYAALRPLSRAGVRLAAAGAVRGVGEGVGP